MSAEVGAALVKAQQEGMFDLDQNPGQVDLLSDNAQYQLRLLISEGLGEAVQHMVTAQVWPTKLH